MTPRRVLIAAAFLSAFASQAIPAEKRAPKRFVQGVEAEATVNVQFYRTIPGFPGVHSVHGPYIYVRERYEGGVRTLYHAGPGPAQETALAVMTSPDGWEIIGDSSGPWDILSVHPNEY